MTPHCAGAGVYVRPYGVAVCLGCGAKQANAVSDWTQQTVAYCAPGLHHWGPRYADDHPRQCVRCPAVELREGKG